LARRFTLALAATAALAVGLAGCSSPSSNIDGPPPADSSAGAGRQQQTIDKDARGPAPDVAGAKKGGNISVYAESSPMSFDPTDIYSYTDSREIGKLLFRTPTQFAIRNGKPVLVPDLTDVGTVSADKLSWTFKMQPGIKFEDGAPVTVDDLAYSIKRSFAHDVYVSGPTYQLQYFKNGNKYKGPYASGETYSGVETQGTDTLVIHLAKPFSDLPFYLTFPAFTPIPKAKDNRQDYQNHPVATGPYMFDTYSAGSELKLKKNPNWDANTDAVRHQYAETWDFKWGANHIETQLRVLLSNGPYAQSISYDNIDASLIPQLSGNKRAQLVQGDSPCTYAFPLDTRKIPLEVRKAIATAYPYDPIYKAAGLNDYTAEKASTILPPSVPGHTKYTPLPYLNGAGNGDPAAAKQMLTRAGKLGFELSWYFDNIQLIPQQISNIRRQAMEAAGFKVKTIGVATADLRTKISDYDAPVNTGQAPAGWCSDWPTGGSWFPMLFESHSVADGFSWGMLSDKSLDAEIDATADLPTDQATSKWAALDQKILGLYIALPRYYPKMAVISGTDVGGAEGDPTAGEPFYVNMYVKR